MLAAYLAVMAAEEINVLIVDDNASFRDSLNLLFSSSKGFKLVGALESGEHIEKAITHLKPEVILMDIDMPEVNGTEAVRILRKVDAQLPVIMLTAFEDDNNVFDSICAGATGYLLKNAEPIQILNAIKDVHGGGAPMTPSIARKVLSLFKEGNQKKEANKQVVLSKREREVLSLLVEGHSYKMIGAELSISYETVHSHIKKIYKILQVNSATEAVAKSLKDNII